MRKSTVELQKQIGYNVRYCREMRQVSQSDLADAAGFSVNFCAQVEGGRRMMSVDSLIRVAEALNVSVDRLIYGKSWEANMHTVVNELGHLSDDDIAVVGDMLNLLIKRQSGRGSQE